MTALLLEPATEHACRCGADPARVWVQVADDHQPLCRGCAARAASDPVFLAGLTEAYREPCEDVLPPFRAAVSPPQRKSGQALAARVRRDPELRQSYVQLGYRLAAIRRQCGQCDMTSNPGGLALHQRHTNHHGYTEVSR